MKSSLIVFALFASAAASPDAKQNFPNCTKEFPHPTECNPATCLPANDCACFGSEPDIPLAQRPQIVYLTFDDAFTKLAADDYYSGLFGGDLKNPNGCAIRATHYLTHRSTDYTLVNAYYAKGHEMASHSITHRTNLTYWTGLDEQGWVDEMDGMRTIANAFGNIPKYAMKGMRVPFLQIGGDTMFAMMSHNNFEYDCSSPTQKYGYIDMANGVWPFTMDYINEMDCQIEPCSKCSFPNIWTQPMLDLEDSWFDADGDITYGNQCAMLDSCIIPGSSDSEDVYEMLMRNFNRAYSGNTRAPFGLYMHAAWFFGQDFRYQGYKKFLTEITTLDDVWIVPVSAGIEYRKNPKTNDQLKNGELPAFNCDNFPDPDCINSQSCSYIVDNEDIPGQEVYMQVCTECPPNYPWLGNPLGI